MQAKDNERNSAEPKESVPKDVFISFLFYCFSVVAARPEAMGAERAKSILPGAGRLWVIAGGDVLGVAPGA